MGEMSKLGWLIGWSSKDMWADPFYFLYVVLGSICKTLASFQHILWFCGFFHMHVGLILIFQENPMSGYICVLNAYGVLDKDKMIDNVQKCNICTIN
jgi:hypothetical protein